jgi:hypothetical protein
MRQVRAQGGRMGQIPSTASRQLWRSRTQRGRDDTRRGPRVERAHFVGVGPVCVVPSPIPSPTSIVTW